MNDEENIQKSNRLKDLQTSKIILCKLIKHYSYNSIVDYLFNPNKISNPKLESIMKRLISKMGIDNLAFLLCSENLNSFKINNEKEEEKSFTKNNNNDMINQRNKYKTFLIKKKYKNRMINKEKKFNKNKILFHNYFKHKKSKNIHLDEDDSSSESNNYFDSYNNIRSDSDNSNEDSSSINSDSSKNSSDDENNIQNSSYNSYCNDFDEFCDSEVNKANIINLVNEMEEEEESNSVKNEEIQEELDEKKEIILDDTNSYVCKIIYKTKSGELYYYCFEKLNEDYTITMKCIDELCKSKGIYNPKNKQIIILTEHTIEYEAHCYFKINFGGNELDLGIFDFIKDTPEITGIEILKSKDNIKIKEKNKEKEIKEEKEEIVEYNMDLENKNEKNNEDNTEKFLEINKKEENEETDIKKEKIIENKNDNNLENNSNLDIEGDEKCDSKIKNLEENIENEKNIQNEPIYQNRICNNITQIIKKIKNKEINIEKKDIKENFTLFNFNNNINTNNIRTTKPNLTKKNKESKEIDFIPKDEIKNISTDTNKLTNDESNNYNFIEFNIDNIKKNEGTENSYSKEVYKINLENKKLVDEQNKIIERNKRNRSKRGIVKLKEKINERENIRENEIYPKVISHCSSPSYLIDEDDNNATENENDIESEFSKLSVISHFQNKKYEEKIIIEENDSFFSFDMLSIKEKEKYNKRINDEIISISEDYSEKRRKKLEKMKKKLEENNLRKYLKKKEPQRRSLFRVNERKNRDEEEEVNNNTINKRRVFGITRRSMSPPDIKMEIEEEENKEKINEEENNKDKKGMPIFGIFNPNKHNPIFCINNDFNKK